MPDYHLFSFSSPSGLSNSRFDFSYFLVYFTNSMNSPPPILKKPPMKTAFNFEKLARVTRNGAPMFPRLLMASVTPRPVERMAVGKVSAEIRLKRANPTVLKSRLPPISTRSTTCESVN